MRDILKIANIGSGTMGHATAIQFAMAGYPVTIVELGGANLDAAMVKIRMEIDDLVAHGLQRAGDDADAIFARISTTTDCESGVRDADFIIESIVEDLDVKQDVWKRIERFAPADAIFATNTSGLSPTEISEVLERPQRFVVAHFWNPVHLMPLVEVVPGAYTSQAVVDTTYDLMLKLGKKPAKLNKESLGFIGNRLQAAVLREALYLIREGVADAATIDTVVENSIGLRWSILGPIMSADLGGLDIFDNISAYLYEDLCDNPGPDPSLDNKVLDRDLGLKTGRGFYDWTGEAGAQIVAMRDAKLMKALLESRAQETVEVIEEES